MKSKLQAAPKSGPFSAPLFSAWLAGCLWAFGFPGLPARGADLPAAAHFRKNIQPILTEYCYDCHADGMNKGGVAFDEFKSDDLLVQDRTLWWAVLKNVRAGIMPPAKKPRPSSEEKEHLERWIKHEAFGIDPNNPDPGRITIRRLNRIEYRNTIRDLMGIDFKTDEEFPPDDTGYGFDNIGDVLTVSPLLLEKYMQAAETIVARAVPLVAKVVPEKILPGTEFHAGTSATNGDRLTFYQESKVSRSLEVKEPGDYRLMLEIDVAGQFDFDPGRCRLVLKVNDQERWRQEFGWNSQKKFRFELSEKWQAGEHHLSFELLPLTAPDQKRNSLDLRIISVRAQGPLDPSGWSRTPNYDRFFTKDEPPKSPAERREYASEVLTRFATKAFRRPVDAESVKRLVGIAEALYNQPGKSFEEGAAQAMVAVIASPRFLFRVEQSNSTPRENPYSLVDEYSLSSRLSYFLWSTMPDEELFRLAERGELRNNLKEQVMRLLRDPRSRALTENFTGQWLQVRDVEGIDINARAVLAREDKPRENRESPGNRPRRFGPPRIELDGALRRAMRQETEMFFGNIVREDRPVLELLDSDYTFLNERLAKHYGVDEVTGNEMRRVSLPKDHPRGGLLTQGSVLVVTSNPTRTSPVKRGLFILDNILGTPPPPPPADVPLLEEAEKEFKDREPTLREALELHRGKPLCSACHSRMDPLGLALENFNALGLWRDQERGQPIDATGKLITGESFADIREVKRILVQGHRADFYRCLTEKLLTYALGRGLEYYDVESVDKIVDRLEREEGRFSALLLGVIESAPFQKRRNASIPSPQSPSPGIKP